jgi:hypothetical protein
MARESSRATISFALQPPYPVVLTGPNEQRPVNSPGKPGSGHSALSRSPSAPVSSLTARASLIKVLHLDTASVNFST